MSRHIKDLDPNVIPHIEAVMLAWDKAGIKYVITNTLRTIAEQDHLYAKGRTAPGFIVTNAKGGYSYHNYGLAIDFCPLVDGKCAWGRLDLFKQMGEIAKGFGFVWGGDWKSFPDRPHLQMTFGLTIKDLLNGKRPPKKDTPSEWAVESMNKAIKLGLTDGSNPKEIERMIVILDRLGLLK